MDVLNAFQLGMLTVEYAIFTQPTQTLSATAFEVQIAVVGAGPVAINIGSVLIHAQATLAASDSNYWLWQVYKHTNAAPGTQVLIAQGSTAATLNNPVAGGGGLTAWKAASLTIQTGTGSYISPLDVVTVVVTKTGTPANISYSLAGFTTAN